MEKSTHQGYRTELFVPIMASAKGKYIAVLSDDSCDRDEEMLSSSCVEDLAKGDSYLAALCNHKNDIFMQVAEWTNKRVEKIGTNTALVAEPKFFMSNPNAKIIKGMLDEGAKLGISIGAMVLDYDEFDGKRVFTSLELLEASFVAIPSNRHGRAMAVAKSFKRNKEEIKVEKEFTQKDIDSAIEKKVEELTKTHADAIAKKDAELSKMKEDMEKKVAELEKSNEDAKAEKEEAEAKAEESEKKLEAEKKASLEKQKFVDKGGEGDSTPEDAEKSMSEGKLPITYM